MAATIREKKSFWSAQICPPGRRSRGRGTCDCNDLLYVSGTPWRPSIWFYRPGYATRMLPLKRARTYTNIHTNSTNTVSPRAGGWLYFTTLVWFYRGGFNPMLRPPTPVHTWHTALFWERFWWFSSVTTRRRIIYWKVAVVDEKIYARNRQIKTKR